jgi:hypothetical protein
MLRLFFVGFLLSFTLRGQGFSVLISPLGIQTGNIMSKEARFVETRD